MSDDGIMPTNNRSPWPWRLRMLAVVVLAAAGMTLISIWAFGSDAPAPRTPTRPSVGIAHDSTGQVIHLDTTVTAEQAAVQDAVDVVGEQQIEIPSVGFDAPLGAITVLQGAVTPPRVLSAYWIRNLGVSPADGTSGTVFVVIHTVHGNANVPGNKLIDVAGARSALSAGALINVAGHSYRVARTAVISRDALPSSADVWTSRPGQLVLITCLERPDGRTAISNVVVWAELA